MNKYYLAHLHKLFLYLYLILFTLGCKSNLTDNENKNNEFIFSSLNLVQTNPDGSIHWKISSPKAKLVSTDMNIEAYDPLINLFDKGLIQYEIRSNLLESISNELFTLRTDVRIKTILNNTFNLYGNELQWIPNTHQINLIGKSFLEKQFIQEDSNNLEKIKVDTRNDSYLGREN